MNFLSQIFLERSAHRDGLYLFSDFRVHSRKGDIDDLEQKCPAVDRLSLLPAPSIESLIVHYWFEHFLPTNNITQVDYTQQKG